MTAQPAERLRATFTAAMDFGLTDEECWAAAKEVAARTDPDTPALESHGAVVEALARRVQPKLQPNGW